MRRVGKAAVNTPQSKRSARCAEVRWSAFRQGAAAGVSRRTSNKRGILWRELACAAAKSIEWLWSRSACGLIFQFQSSRRSAVAGGSLLFLATNLNWWAEQTVVAPSRPHWWRSCFLLWREQHCFPPPAKRRPGVPPDSKFFLRKASLEIESTHRSQRPGCRQRQARSPCSPKTALAGKAMKMENLPYRADCRTPPRREAR